MYNNNNNNKNNNINNSNNTTTNNNTNNTITTTTTNNNNNNGSQVGREHRPDASERFSEIVEHTTRKPTEHENAPLPRRLRNDYPHVFSPHLARGKRAWGLCTRGLKTLSAKPWRTHSSV